MPVKNGSGIGMLRQQERPAGVSDPPRRPLLARSSFSGPEELLLALVQADSASRVTRVEVQPLEDPAFRSAFQSVITGHGVIGLALTALRRCDGFGGLRSETQNELMAPLRPFAFQAALWDAERDRLLRVLREHSLIPVVLKGGALRLTVYDDPAERLSGDLDLLVSPHRVCDGLEALAEAGYVDYWTEEARREHLRHGYHLSVSHANGFEVELHWDLAPRGEAFHFDPAAFLNRSVLHEREGVDPIRVPSPEHMMLHLAYQNREDSFSRLKRLVDIDRVIRASRQPGLDWGYVVSQARRGGLATVLALSLQLVRRLLLTPVPAHVDRDLNASPLARAHIALLNPEAFVVTQQAHHSTVAKRALHLWLISSWRCRARWARRIIDGSANPMAHVYSVRRGRVISRSLHARGKRLYALMRMGVYHGLLYSAALRDRLTISGNRRSFWSNGRRSSPRPPVSEQLPKGAPWTSPANTTS